MGDNYVDKYRKDVTSTDKGWNKFTSDMGARQRIAQDNGATYELHSNTPIPQNVKNWLDKKGIKYYQY